MIERAVGYLEHGGRGLLRLHKKPFRTRRYLHSAFWSHGAGDIDLPAWWKFLLQAPEFSNAAFTRNKSKSATKDVAASLHEIFLQLLYPVQNHALIQRLNRVTRLHRQAAQIAKQGARKYTSVAEDLLAGKTNVRDDGQWEEDTTGDMALQEKAEALSPTAEELLEHPDRSEDYDKLWKLQQDAFETSKPLKAETVLKIFYSLSASERKIDLERSLALFETFNKKTPMLYRRAVKVALRLTDLDTAVDIHLEAITTHSGSTDVGTPDILNYAIQNEQWRLAIDTWYRLWQSKLLYFSLHRDLWKEIDALPLQKLLLKTEMATDFALSVAGSAGNGPSHEAINAARDFALAMSERAFEVRGSRFSPAQYLRLIKKIKSLTNSSTKICMRALGQLLSLRDHEYFPKEFQRRERGFLMAAVEIYRELHHDPAFSPSKGLLRKMLTGLAILRSPSGMLMVLKDWQRYVPVRLSANCYVTMAKVLAESGQVEELENVLSHFTRDYPADDVSEGIRAKVLNLSLWVHFKRADTQAILRKFDELQKQHGFAPTTASYNLVIMTFVRVEDVENAMSWFKSLKDNGLSPDQHTFSSLMSLYAKRGDIDAVQDIWQELMHSDVKPSLAMIDAFVVANVKDERYKEAEDLIESALKMNLEGPRTHMWNVLINAYALRANLEKVSILHERMHSAGVPEDSWTYAAILLSLCVAGNVKSAWRVMRTVMPRLGISRTVFHYAILMGGYMKTKDYRSVFFCYKDMLEKKLVPDVNVYNTLLRAAARSDRKDSKLKGAAETDFKRARDVFDMTLQNLDPAQLTAAGPRKFSSVSPVDQALTSSFYGYMTYLHGRESSLSKVSELYDNYIATTSKTGKGDAEDSPPIMMLSALLTVHRRAGNDEEVDRCWYLALDKLEKLCKRSNANLAEPGWVLPARQYLVNPLLREYMKYLGDGGRIDDMISVIKDLRWAGYELHSPKWNDYVRYLASSFKPQHRYLAFEVCERELMQNWPGWLHLATDGAETSTGSWWHMRKVMRRENRGGAMLPSKRVVRYKTLVQLAGVYGDAKSGHGKVAADDVSREQLAKLAPVTVDAVRRLPKLPDRSQMTYLPDRSSGSY